MEYGIYSSLGETKKYLNGIDLRRDPEKDEELDGGKIKCTGILQA
jgi:hypothetical protein